MLPVGEGTMRSVMSLTTSVFALARDRALDTFEFLQRAVVPMLIFDGSHDQGVNLFGAGRGISSNDCSLAAGQRPRARNAGPRRQEEQGHPQRHDVSYLNHAFAWRCRVWPGPPRRLQSDSTAELGGCIRKFLNRAIYRI